MSAARYGAQLLAEVEEETLDQVRETLETA